MRVFILNFSILPQTVYPEQPVFKNHTFKKMKKCFYFFVNNCVFISMQVQFSTVQLLNDVTVVEVWVSLSATCREERHSFECSFLESQRPDARPTGHIIHYAVLFQCLFLFRLNFHVLFTRTNLRLRTNIQGDRRENENTIFRPDLIEL